MSDQSPKDVPGPNNSLTSSSSQPSSSCPSSWQPSSSWPFPDHLLASLTKARRVLFSPGQSGGRFLAAIGSRLIGSGFKLVYGRGRAKTLQSESHRLATRCENKISSSKEVSSSWSKKRNRVARRAS